MKIDNLLHKSIMEETKIYFCFQKKDHIRFLQLINIGNQDIDFFCCWLLKSGVFPHFLCFFIPCGFLISYVSVPMKKTVFAGQNLAWFKDILNCSQRRKNKCVQYFVHICKFLPMMVNLPAALGSKWPMGAYFDLWAAGG